MESGRDPARLPPPAPHRRRVTPQLAFGLALAALAVIAVARFATGGASSSDAPVAVPAPTDPGLAARPSSPNLWATSEPAIRSTPVPTAAPTEAPPDAASQLAPDPALQLDPTDNPVVPVEGDSRVWLFYGGEDPLQRLDLTTGTVDVFGLRARPLLVAGDELVLDRGGLIGWVGLDDPAEMAEGWSQATVVPGPEPGQLWFHSERSSAWTLRTLATNAVLERRLLPELIGLKALAPDLAAFAGSLYTWDGTRWTAVATGEVTAVDDVAVEVTSCAVTLDECASVRLDRRTWEPIDDPTRPPSPGANDVIRTPDGTWSAELVRPGRAVLRHAVTGEAIEVDFAVGEDGGGLLFAQSSD